MIPIDFSWLCDRWSLVKIHTEYKEKILGSVLGIGALRGRGPPGDPLPHPPPPPLQISSEGAKIFGF